MAGLGSQCIFFPSWTSRLFSYFLSCLKNRWELVVELLGTRWGIIQAGHIYYQCRVLLSGMGRKSERKNSAGLWEDYIQGKRTSWLIISHSHCTVGKQRLRMNTKETTLRWESLEMHYKGDMANFSCRQTCGHVPLLAVTFKLGTGGMENIKFWCQIMEDRSDIRFNSLFLRHRRCWDERERETEGTVLLSFCS